MNLGITSLEFIFLLPIVCLVYYLFPTRARHYWLLIVNLLFYAGFGPVYVLIVVTEAFICWLFSLFSSRNRVSGHILYIACVIVLASLIPVFKITPRYLDSITAPLGISFYTLQAISYVTDVYQKRVSPETNPVVLLIYLSFFPTITSGPIYRYNEFAPVFTRNRSELKADYNRITNAIIYIVYGYFLKLVIAERVAIPVNNVYSDFGETRYSGIVLLIIAVAYSVQIYADFAGYSAIVIGIAEILGYDIPENFKAPYLARSIKEFWSRWHISLSTWLRDYIYIPLGGNRKSRLRKYINIMITFIVSGLWHGLYGHFLIWGGIHGLYQVIGDMTPKIRRKLCLISGLREGTFFDRLIQRICTFMLVTFAWIFFRNGISESVQIITTILFHPHIGQAIDGELWDTGLSPFWWLFLLICIMLLMFTEHLCDRKKMRIDKAIASQGSFAKGVIVIVMVLMILILGVYGDQHDASYFIYRDF